MEIRMAKAQDVPGIIKLLQQVGRVHHEGRPDLFRSNAQKYGPSQVLEMLGKGDTPIFVAVEEEKVLGYGFCIMENRKFGVERKNAGKAAWEIRGNTNDVLPESWHADAGL